MSEPPKYAYPYPAQGQGQGYDQGPPVMAPPQYTETVPRGKPPRGEKTAILEGCLAALCFCCLLDGCCELCF